MTIVTPRLLEDSWRKCFMGVARSKSFTTGEKIGQVSMMGVVVEPIRYVTKWFMTRSRIAQDPRLMTALCDLVNPQWSPVVVCRQYLSDLITGAKRTILLWKRSGFNSFTEWVRSKPAEAAHFRRLVLTADVWVFHRHSEIRSWPWMLAGLCDPRLPDDDKRKIAYEFLNSNPCCLDECFGRKLHKDCTEGKGYWDSLFSEQTMALLRGWAVAVSPLLTTATVENRHARNRKNNTSVGGKQSMATFGARYVVSEAITHQKARHAANAIMNESQETNTPTSAANPHQRNLLPIADYDGVSGRATAASIVAVDSVDQGELKDMRVPPCKLAT